MEQLSKGSLFLKKCFFKICKMVTWSHIDGNEIYIRKSNDSGEWRGNIRILLT